MFISATSVQEEPFQDSTSSLALVPPPPPAIIAEVADPKPAAAYPASFKSFSSVQDVPSYCSVSPLVAGDNPGLAPPNANEDDDEPPESDVDILYLSVFKAPPDDQVALGILLAL